MEANADTPCVFNVGSLLNAALASEYLGDNLESKRLEAKADAIGMEGFRQWLYPPRIRLAVARNDLDEVRRLADGIGPDDLLPCAYETPAAMFDALDRSKHISGFIIWKYESDPNRKDERGYLPKDKPAEAIIRRHLH